MLWYKPKFTQGVSPFIMIIKCWLHGHCFRELTILLLCTPGQRYDHLLLRKSWQLFFNGRSCMPDAPPIPRHPTRELQFENHDGDARRLA